MSLLDRAINALAGIGLFLLLTLAYLIAALRATPRWLFRPLDPEERARLQRHIDEGW
jgi:HAMP domain-containing protein